MGRLGCSHAPGFGIPHPDLLAILDHRTPVGVHRETWGNGLVPLEFACYLGIPDLPDDIIASVRCIVAVDESIVVCETPSGPHACPGGGREAGETYQQTAVREVLEETGWHVDPDSMVPLGFVHLRLLEPAPAGYRYPHPDSIQLIYGGRANTRVVGFGDEWVDTEGWEQRSYLSAKDQVLELPLAPSSVPFLRAYIS